MKTRIIIAICFILSLSLLSAYDIYGAFRVKTSPRGADVNLYDIDEYLSDTPTDVFPVYMDEFMEFREGIPGREIVLMITKRGYQPLKKRVFVPFRFTNLEDAMDNPTVFDFDLSRDRRREYYDVCYYYSIRTVRVRPYYVYWTPSPRPWYPHWHHHHNPPYIPGGGHSGGSGGGSGGYHDGGVISPPGGGGHGGGHDGGSGGGNHDGGVVIPPNGGSYKLDTESNANGQNQISRPPRKQSNPTIEKDKIDATPSKPGRNTKSSKSTVVIGKPQTPQKEESPRAKQKDKSDYQASKSDNKTDSKSYKSEDKANKTNDTPVKDKDDEKTKSTKDKRK